jgi:MFS family permease
VGATAVVGGLLARSTGVGVRPPDPGVEPLTIARALRRPTYRAALTSGLATGWAVQGVRVALVPLFVAVALGRAPVWAGVALTVFAVGDGAMLLATSGLSDRRGRRPVVVAGLAMIAVGTACLGVLPDLVVLLVASLVAGAGAGLLQPAQGAAVADLIGSRRSGGPALSGFQMASDVGAIIGPLAAGALAQYVGFAAAFGVSGAVALAAMFVWLATTEPEVRAPDTPRPSSSR